MNHRPKTAQARTAVTLIGKQPRNRLCSATVRPGTILLLLLGSGLGTAPAGEPWPAPDVNPWGISSSASSARTIKDWLPKMAEIGVATVRLFPEWRQLEPTPGVWRWEPAEALVQAAAASHVEINAILMGSPPATKKVHAFPMQDLDGWSNYVASVVGHYRGRIRQWEVWNEGNGGFNDDHSTTADYARLALTTYAAARRADPQARIGLSVASFDAPYLNQAILAMARDGHSGCFDFLCIHPYEVADGLTDPDGEIPFLWMNRFLRDMLKASAPDRAQADIWITEVGRRLERRNGRNVTEADAAGTLVKVYTMAIAQGIRNTQWFEAQDPVGEDPGFGLLNRDGTPRASYGAFKSLTALLGPTPRYEGWLAIGQGGRGYGFIFQGRTTPVLVAWMPAGLEDDSLTFQADVAVLDLVSGTVSRLEAGRGLSLTNRPVAVTGVPAGLLQEARANATRTFAWGGDYSGARSISGQPGQPELSQGVFQVSRDSTPSVRFPDASTGILLRGDQAASFYVHPSFASFQTKEYFVRVTVRRVAPGNVGMNLFYEVADSQGRVPYKNRGEWFSVPAEAGWHSHTWHVTDACLSKMWGYDLSFRPEQSVPFVLGKVEVSTVPFK